MDHYKRLRRQMQLRLFMFGMLAQVTLLVVLWIMLGVLELPLIVSLAIGGGYALLYSVLMGQLVGNELLQPVRALWQAILHVSPEHQGEAAPHLDNLKIGRELVTSLAMQVYQIASQETTTDVVSHRQAVIQATNIVSHLPLPLFVFNREQLVTHASDTAIEYCEIKSADLFGKPLFDNVNLEFPSEFTLEKWIEECQNNKVTDRAYWERVRVRLKKEGSDAIRQCDMAAYYNRDNPSGTEFIVTMYDHTARYDQDDRSMSFVALAVHELRTPLTMLRGYIEVFEEELGNELNDELKDFMHKMQVSASQLTAFVNNILNVSRVQENQLTLNLVEEDWAKVLNAVLNDTELRAQVHGKVIERNIAPNLPTVGVDKVSIYEVMSNLLDNAIKYSGTSKRIVVTAGLGKDGLVETTVQDFGVGMPSNVLSNLFEKFYRNHRTRNQVGGTGLGLYLSKAIVNAHGGQIWALSKEGEGSTFGFSLAPYSQLAEELKNSNNKDIVRQTHGWVKNHSLYRR